MSACVPRLAWVPADRIRTAPAFNQKAPSLSVNEHTADGCPSSVKTVSLAAAVTTPTRYRFRPQQRLAGADVTRTVGRGRTRSAGELKLHYIANNLDFARIAQIIPKRMARRAVDRARLRRQAREAFRLNQARWNGYDCVVRLRSLLASGPVSDVDRGRQLAELFQRGP